MMDDKRFGLVEGSDRELYLLVMSTLRRSLFQQKTLSLWLLWGSAALVSGLILALAFWVDAALVALVRTQSAGWSRWLAGRISYWGDWYGVLAVGAAVWFWGRRNGRVGVQRLLVLMGLCAAISGLGANVIRASTGRARPNAQAAPGWYGPAEGMRFAKNARDFQSFPSAHTAVVAGFFAPLGLVARRRKRYGLLSLALAGTALMMWARVWIGAHHLSDVCAAAALGWALGWVVLRRGGWNT